MHFRLTALTSTVKSTCEGSYAELHAKLKFGHTRVCTPKQAAVQGPLVDPHFLLTVLTTSGSACLSLTEPKHA